MPAEHWQSMMRRYPSDGWDGAAALIARHDAEVCVLERELDAADPGWHTRLTDAPRRRTRPAEATTGGADV